jgi:hypothetical protein
MGVSETAFFVKDVFGPKGSVSIVAKKREAVANLLPLKHIRKLNPCAFIMLTLTKMKNS